MSSPLEDFLRGAPGWALKQGPLCDVILSSRLRLARNLDSLPFPTRSVPDQAATVVSRLESVLSQAPVLSGARFVDVDVLSPEDRNLLMERRLISRELAQGSGPRGVVIDAREELSVMVNEEDHLRFQVMLPGLQLGEALDRATSAESSLEGYLAFAFSETYGYLTACPTNVGTGLRASVLMHLPGLVLTRRVSKLLRAAQAMNMAVRGFQGEGSEVVGNFVQISNQTTLGLDEQEVLRRLEGLVHTLIKHEAEAVEFMWSAAPHALEDKIYRALGGLMHARNIELDEVMSLTSAVRLGHRLKLGELPSIQALNEVVLWAQPAHLERWVGRSLETEEAGFLRADRIRETLAKRGYEPSPDPSRN